MLLDATCLYRVQGNSQWIFLQTRYVFWRSCVFGLENSPMAEVIAHIIRLGTSSLVYYFRLALYQ